MVESFLIALSTLLVALYIQARAAAREVQRDRDMTNAANRRKIVPTRQP
jgi:hypothetical protein